MGSVRARASRGEVLGRALAVLLLGAASAPAAPAPAPARTAVSKHVLCWTDDKGQRACGDSVPAQYSNKERQVFDPQGRVREVKPRERTAAEVEAEEKDAKARDEALKAAQKQRDYDRFLLATYTTDKDIVRARDERLNMLDGRRKLAEKSVVDNQKAVEQQQARIDNIAKGGKTASPALTKKLNDLQQTLAANKKSIEEIDAQKKQIGDKYGADLTRYQQLRVDNKKN